MTNVIKGRPYEPRTEHKYNYMSFKTNSGTQATSDEHRWTQIDGSSQGNGQQSYAGGVPNI